MWKLNRVQPGDRVRIQFPRSMAILSPNHAIHGKEATVRAVGGTAARIKIDPDGPTMTLPRSYLFPLDSRPGPWAIDSAPGR